MAVFFGTKIAFISEQDVEYNLMSFKGNAQMLRITLVSQVPEEVVLKVEGEVAGEEVQVLEQVGTQWHRKTERLVLDLKGVLFIDEAGIAVLRQWLGERLVLRGGSLFIQLLLRTHGLLEECATTTATGSVSPTPCP